MRLGRPLTIGLAFIGLVAGAALVSLAWTPDDPSRMHFALKLRGPLAAGLLGTDQFGRDVASMLMVGARNSLTIALLSVGAGGALGTLLGVAAAALPGSLLDGALMRLCDVLFAFPSVLSAIMIGALLGPGALTAIIAIAAFMVPVFARVARGSALQVWTRDFILAARMAGKGSARITLDHVLPNIASQIIVQATIQLGLAILTEAGLSFLGLGMAPPAPSWGRMLADSQTYLAQAPHLALAPGIAIAVAVLGFNRLGDGLSELADPRRRRAR
ncbi:MAG TPA: ABC transporter permease [Lichenihabitans sp.]|jgi:peptide/nickel transport system permease protein|nr:ABC transporter permease [Lichenihabitans sp.]